MPYRHLFVFNGLAALIELPILVYGVRYVGGNWEHILAKVQRFQGVIVASVLALLLGAWLYRRFFKSRNLPP